MRIPKISYNMLVYANEDISVGIERLARYGYDGVDIVGEPSQYDTTYICEHLKKNNIEASSICAVFNAERDFISANPHIRQAAAAYVKQCVDFASAVGAKAISVQASACMKTKAEASREEEWSWAVAGLREAGKYAGVKNINLTLEAWNRYETHFINRVEQAHQMVAEIGLDNVGVMADTFHMNIEESHMGDAIRKLGDKLYYVHIADSNRAAPGRGHIDFDEIAKALNDINYDGWISMELLPAAADPFGGEVEEAFYDQYSEESIEFLKNLFTKY